MSLPVAHSGRVHVAAGRCATCIFRPGNLMDLAEGRVEGMVEEAVANESVIVCHDTTHGQAEQELVCRGYFERHARHVVALRLAVAIGCVELI